MAKCVLEVVRDIGSPFVFGIHPWLAKVVVKLNQIGTGKAGSSRLRVRDQPDTTVLTGLVLDALQQEVWVETQEARCFRDLKQFRGAGRSHLDFGASTASVA